MVIKIKRYNMFLTKDHLAVWSEWPHGTYRMSFKIKRRNPFTWIRPIYWMLVRKFNPAYYFQRFPDNEWDLCLMCGNIANEATSIVVERKYLKGLTRQVLWLCEGCHQKYQ